MKFLSVCSGIDCASLAWNALGWEAVAFAEIEPFPSRVLEVRFPGVPNLGDLTRWKEWPEELLAQVDILAGGTPCQAFSIAGLRESLGDARGNLTLVYVQLIDHIDRIRARYGRSPVICVWENVPGVLSTRDNAFGCFLGALAGESVPLDPSGGRWTNAGYVRGPTRAIAWRSLDAQYFNLAQRRQRVFVVGSAREGFRPEEVLFESEGMRRDSPPRRQTGEGVAGTLTRRALDGSSPCGGDGRDGLLVTRGGGTEASLAGRGVEGLSGALREKRLDQGTASESDFLMVADVAPTLSARTKGGGGLGTDFDLDGGLIAGTVTAKWAKGSGGPSGDECQNLVALPAVCPLCCESLIARGIAIAGTPCSCSDPILADPISTRPYQDRGSDDNNLLACPVHDVAPCLTGNYGKQPDSSDTNSGPMLIPVMAFDCKASGQNGFGIGEVAPTVRSMGHKKTHQNAGGQVAICFDTTQITSAENRANPQPGDPCHTLQSGAHAPAIAFTLHGTDGTTSVATETDVASCLRSRTPGMIENSTTTVALSNMAVRRLTPRECERLQGVEDDHTLIPLRGKPAEQCPDGPRYKALGNSWAMPVVRWIGQRINLQVERMAA